MRVLFHLGLLFIATILIVRQSQIAEASERVVIWASSTIPEQWSSQWPIIKSHSWGIQNLKRGTESQGSVTTFLRAFYPKGSVSPSASKAYGTPIGGGQFILLLDEPLEAACLEYDVRFQTGFQFNKGGKLPGLVSDPNLGGQFDGHKMPDGTDGFSTRFMWRSQGAGEVYAYLPPQANKSLKVNSDHGTSLSRGAFYFQPGQWTHLRQEVYLNTPGKADGQIMVWVGKQLVIHQTGIVFRTIPQLTIKGILFSTFFGGRDPSWASSQDQYADFANFKVSRLSGSSAQAISGP